LPSCMRCGEGECEDRKDDEIGTTSKVWADSVSPERYEGEISAHSHSHNKATSRGADFNLPVSLSNLHVNAMENPMSWYATVTSNVIAR